MIQAQSAFLLAGILYILMPLTTWVVLYRRHDPISTALWSFGGILFGASFLLISFQATVQIFVLPIAVNAISFSSHLFRGDALLREAGGSLRWRLGFLVWLLQTLAYIWAHNGFELHAPRLVISTIANCLAMIWLAWLAWEVRLRYGYRSATLIVVSYGVFALSLAVRVGSILLNWNEALPFFGTPGFGFLFASSVGAAVFGNLGYIGIALEKTHVKELASSAELAREQERHLQAEKRVCEQSALLAERDRMLSERDQMLAEREEMLSSIAHEVRQPLNNANSALQSAALALRKAPENWAAADTRIERAMAVLTCVTAAVDNVLADAVLLSNSDPVSCQDISIDIFIDLTLADLVGGGQGRVRKDYLTDIKTVSINVGLMRLALRNLLTNALAYSHDGSRVVVRIAHNDNPLSLVLDIVNTGPAFPTELLPRLFTRGARGTHASNPHGHGLGLSIVRRVAEKHGGNISLLSNEPGQVVMRLTIPQGY